MNLKQSSTLPIKENIQLSNQALDPLPCSKLVCIGEKTGSFSGTVTYSESAEGICQVSDIPGDTIPCSVSGVVTNLIHFVRSLSNQLGFSHTPS